MSLLMVLFLLLSLAIMIGITAANKSRGTSLDTSGGFSIDCPCIDVSSIFISASNCIVENTDDEPGFSIFKDNIFDNSSICMPVTYGSNSCIQHDMSLYPSCQVDNYNNTSTQDIALLPEFCYESWCYVDYDLCKNSQEIFRRTQLFSDSGLTLTGSNSLYFSYSTCNASDFFADYTTTKSTNGKFITVVIPEILFPLHYKEGYDNDGVDGNMNQLLYKNDTIPWKGGLINYLNDLVDVSDIGGFSYTHRSGGSLIARNSSVYTATVFDIKNEISCLGAGQFWVTSERLEMTPFTTPLTFDKVMLWVRNPYIDIESDSMQLYQQTINILKPFDRSLWLTLLASLLVVSIMHVWFITKKEERNVWRNKFRDEAYKNGNAYFKIATLLNVILDSFLDTAQMVFGGSVFYFDADTYTSRKILNFGFGLLILITVAAYTANLAAFLTTTSIKHPFIESIEEAIAAKVPLCAHSALKRSLILAYPDAVWVFPEDTGAFDHEIFNDMHENFDNGHCRGLVAGLEIISMDEKLMTSFCDQKLVYTGSAILEIPVALPVCEHMVGGISYWMYEAKKKGITYDSYRDQSRPTEVCPLSLRHNQIDGDNDALIQLKVVNFTLPLLMLGCCCIISAALQLRHQKRGRIRRQTMLLTRDDVVGLDEEKVEEKEREDIDNDHQKQYQHQHLFQQPIMFPPIEDIPTQGPVTMLRTLRDLRNYQDNLQIYERNLFESMVKEQQSKEHKE